MVARPSAADAHEARVRFDVALVHRLGPEVPLDDDIRLGESVVDVAERDRHAARDVRRGVRRRVVAVRAQEVVQHGRVGLHRFVHVEDPGQGFVVDLDQLQRRLGGLRRRRRDRRHRVSGVERLVAGHDVAAHEAQVGGTDHHGRVEGEVHEVVARHHGFHAGRRGGAPDVDGPDARVRVRAAQHLAPQHAGLGEVRAERRAPGDLVLAVGADRALADPPVVGFFAHDSPPAQRPIGVVNGPRRVRGRRPWAGLSMHPDAERRATVAEGSDSVNAR